MKKINIKLKKKLACDCADFKLNPVVERTEIKDKLERQKGCFRCVHCCKFLSWTRSKSTLEKIEQNNENALLWLKRAKKLDFPDSELKFLKRMTDNAHPSPYLKNRFEILQLKVRLKLMEHVIEVYEEEYGQLEVLDEMLDDSDETG